METGLSLGSNLEDRQAHLKDATERIARISGVSFSQQAPIYETDPVDVPEEYRRLSFLNTVLIVECDLDVHDLFQKLRDIEALMGRERGSERNAPRTIDIDILYAGELQLSEADLTLPHAQATKRRFVVQPLADVRPSLVLPGETRTMQEILLALTDEDKVVRV